MIAQTSRRKWLTYAPVAVSYDGIKSERGRGLHRVALPAIIRERMFQVIQWALYKVSVLDLGLAWENASNVLRCELFKRAAGMVADQLSADQYQKGSLLQRIEEEPGSSGNYLLEKVRRTWLRLHREDPGWGAPALLQLPPWHFYEEPHEAFHMSDLIESMELRSTFQTGEYIPGDNERGVLSLLNALNEDQQDRQEASEAGLDTGAGENASMSAHGEIVDDNSQKGATLFWLHNDQTTLATKDKVAGRLSEATTASAVDHKLIHVELARALAMKCIRTLKIKPLNRADNIPLSEYPDYKRLRTHFVKKIAESLPTMNLRRFDYSVCDAICAPLLHYEERCRKNIIKQTMSEIWRANMLHLFFLVNPDSWSKRDMDHISPLINSTRTFKFSRVLRDSLTTKGLDASYISTKRVMEGWLHVLLPQVAKEATKDAVKALESIEQTARSIIKDSPDLLVLPHADRVTSTHGISKTNTAAALLFRRLEDQHPELAPSHNTMRQSHNEILISTRNAMVSQNIMSAAVRCQLESPDTWRQLTAASNPEAFRSNAKFCSLAESEIRADLKFRGSLDWLWSPEHRPHLSDAIAFFKERHRFSSNTGDSDPNDSAAENWEASLPYNLDENKPVPSGWTFKGARYVLWCRLQHSPPSDAEIRIRLSSYLQDKSRMERESIDLDEGLKQFCETHEIPYPAGPTGLSYGWTAKDEQILMRGIVANLSLSSIAQHYLPGNQNVSGHLSVIRDRFTNTTDTEILKALVGLHGDLTKGIFIWDRDQTQLRKRRGIPPQKTIILFKATVESWDIHLGYCAALLARFVSISTD